MGKRTYEKRSASMRGRKVTYALKGELVDALDRYAEAGLIPKSTVVAEALGVYLVRREREKLEAAFIEAARDPLWSEDNAAVQKDFARLDAEALLETKRKR